MGSDGAASAVVDLPFPRAQVRPHGRSRGVVRAVGTGKSHGGLEVSVLPGSPARPEEYSRTAWSEDGPLRDRCELIRSLGRVLREHSSDLYGRSRALRADPIVLSDNATTVLADSLMLRANSHSLRAHSRSLRASAVALRHTARTFPEQGERGRERALPGPVMPGRGRAVPGQAVPGSGRAVPGR